MNKKLTSLNQKFITDIQNNSQGPSGGGSDITVRL